MSNKKLTTEEKIEKSKGYVDELARLRERIKTVQSAKKKLDSEIYEELERAYIVNMQELGKHTAGKIGEGFSLEEYIEIVDSIFTLDEAEDFIKSEREKLKHKTEKAETDKSDYNSADEKTIVAETEFANETACSDEDCVSA